MASVPRVLTISFYQAPGGAEPVVAWLRALDRNSRKSIGSDLKTVEFGWPVGMPLVRKLGAGLWELRSHVPGGITRIFFTVVGVLMVLLHAITKKSDKIPKSDLAIAKARRDEVKKWQPVIRA